MLLAPRVNTAAKSVPKLRRPRSKLTNRKARHTHVRECPERFGVLVGGHGLRAGETLEHKERRAVLGVLYQVTGNTYTRRSRVAEVWVRLYH